MLDDTVTSLTEPWVSDNAGTSDPTLGSPHYNASEAVLTRSIQTHSCTFEMEPWRLVPIVVRDKSTTSPLDDCLVGSRCPIKAHRVAPSDILKTVVVKLLNGLRYRVTHDGDGLEA